MKKSKEFHLFHILVTHKYEAEDIIKLLMSGKDFSSLARKYSQCSSGKNGGELGHFNWEKLDEDFREAVEPLPIDKISPTPIRTKFGYHVVLKKKIAT